MRPLPLFRQRRPLRHAKSMLLIGNDHAQAEKFRGLRQECMGPNGQFHLSPGQSQPHPPLFPGRQAPREERTPDAQGLQ